MKPLPITASGCAAEIDVLHARISSAKNTITATKTNLENDRLYNDSRALLLTRIAEFQRELERLELSRRDGAQIIERAHDEINECTRRIRLLKRAGDIAKIVELQKAINEIGSVNPAALEAARKELLEGVGTNDV